MQAHEDQPTEWIFGNSDLAQIWAADRGPTRPEKWLLRARFFISRLGGCSAFDPRDRVQTIRQFVPDTDNRDLTDNSAVAEYQYSYRADGKRTGAMEKVWFDGTGAEKGAGFGREAGTRRRLQD